jgi:Protein of unknown function (DUF1353)
MQCARSLRFLTAGLSVLAPACAIRAQAAPTPVDFRPFSDARFWIVKEPLVYRVGISKDSVVVPRGFVTDFASIPPALQSLIQQNGPNLLPAVVHDFLYWTGTCTRREADQLLKLAMIENRVKPVQQTAIYNAVRAAGSFAWEGNRDEQRRGLVRTIPEGRINVPPLTDWRAYQTQLKAEGVTDGAHLPISQRFCRRGDMSVTAALRTP